LAGETKPSDAFEAALKREMQRPAASDSAECPAPDVLAAYYDRSLSRADRARVDTHLLACVRCQAMMAALVRADDSPSVASSRREAFFWITRVATPIAAIAATIAFMVGLHHRAFPPPEVIALASPVAAIQPQPEAPPSPTTMEQSLPAASPQSVAAGNLIEHQHQMSSHAKAGGAKESQPLARAKSMRSPAELSASSEPVAALAPRVAQLQSSVGSAPAAGVAASGSSPGFVIVTPRVYHASSPDGSVMWSFGSQGIIFLSQNSAPERVVDQMHGELLAGSAPSNDVCWIVGRPGAILRTLDRGAHWQSIKPPASADFTAVSASDSNTATVTASDGQGYITHDGGVTWSPLRP